jgi:hypothetical protein
MESRVILVFRHLLKCKKHHTNNNDNNGDNGVIAVHESAPCGLLSRALFTSCQQPTAVQHFKSALESTMSVTAQMANSAITAIHHKASCHHIAADGPFCFWTLVFLSSWLRLHMLLSIHQGVCRGLMSLELPVAVGTTMIGLVH